MTKQGLCNLCDANWFWLQAAVEEKARVAKEKELETARLRAKQERAADRQAEIDELRARRSALLAVSHSLTTPLLLHVGKVQDIRNFQYTHRNANHTDFQKRVQHQVKCKPCRVPRRV